MFSRRYTYLGLMEEMFGGQMYGADGSYEAS